MKATGQLDLPDDVSRTVTIADVRFNLSGVVGTAPFTPHFTPFLRAGAGADLACDVLAAGPDAALGDLPAAPAAPWAFTLHDDSCEAVRRDTSGRVLWRMDGAADLARVRIAWHPTLFDVAYGSYRGAWAKGLGLTALGMRLRTSGGLLLHGTAAVLDGAGILCVGVSGTGKSTLARILADAGATVLTDERPVVRRQSSPDVPFRIYGTPWPSSAGAARDGWAPLRRLYLLAHGVTDRITPLPPPETVRRLIAVTTIPWQAPPLLDPCLETLEALVRTVPCALLAFRPTAGVVKVLRDDLRLTAKGAPA